jgi:hypothetical protein
MKGSSPRDCGCGIRFDSSPPPLGILPNKKLLY